MIYASKAKVGGLYKNKKGTKVRILSKSENFVLVKSIVTGNKIKIPLDYELYGKKRK
jgi:hypothetical protein